MEISIGFYPANILGGKTIIDVYKEAPEKFDDEHWRKLTYRINIKTKDLTTIKSWQDIRKFSDKKEGGGKWQRDE